MPPNLSLNNQTRRRLGLVSMSSRCGFYQILFSIALSELEANTFDDI